MIHTLKQFPQLRDIPDEQLGWLHSHLEFIEISKGEYLFEGGSLINHLMLIFDGEFELFILQNNNRKRVSRFEKFDITGLLPFSRAKLAVGYAVAVRAAKVGLLHRNRMKELIARNYELTEALVHQMNNRIRMMTNMEVQNEKLIALGKLSAGLAHELNNPASAMVRSASMLQHHLMGLPDDFKRVLKIKADDSTIDCINEFMYTKLGQKSNVLTLLEKTSMEDELYDWFEGCDLRDKYDLIPLLVEYHFTTEDLEELKSWLHEDDFNTILKWIVQNMTTHKTVADIKEASSRIETLIRSVKTYSYMDQSLDLQWLDIHEGIQSTLNVLNHKIGKIGHELVMQLDPNLPKVQGLPGELNQVWTNLIDNAIDALPPKGGKLTIRTRASENFVYVYIQDNGHGIAEEHLNRIFEPFFTTKGVGQGTGLGLDITLKIIKQHNGQIKVSSMPGQTQFEVCLPVGRKFDEKVK